MFRAGTPRAAFPSTSTRPCHRKRRFYTQTLVDRNTLTHRPLYTPTLLHRITFTHSPFYTQTLLHTNALTHNPFYTQSLLHRDPLTHRPFTHRDFDTQTHLHTVPLTQRHCYTQTLVRSTQRRVSYHTFRSFSDLEPHDYACENEFTPSEVAILPQFLAIEPRFVRQARSRDTLGPRKSQFYLSFWRSNLISCESVAKRVFSWALPPAKREKKTSKEEDM